MVDPMGSRPPCVEQLAWNDYNHIFLLYYNADGARSKASELFANSVAADTPHSQRSSQLFTTARLAAAPPCGV